MQERQQMAMTLEAQSPRVTVAQVAEYTGQIQRLREANQALEKRNSELEERLRELQLPAEGGGLTPQQHHQQQLAVPQNHQEVSHSLHL
jgi:cell shape-determining protein MreC